MMLGVTACQHPFLDGMLTGVLATIIVVVLFYVFKMFLGMVIEEKIEEYKNE